MKIGILTGGGDCPGLNAVIRAVVRTSAQCQYQTIGILDGWKGIIEGHYKKLDDKAVAGILHLGGTILGTSRTNPFKVENGPEKIEENMKKEGIDVIICIGGDDTLGAASKLYNRGVKTIGVPKTIDNDLKSTDYTFGFDTAVSIVTEALDRLHSTAESHHRVFVVEVMGRHAGWIATYGGLAGGADYILIPEKPFTIDEVSKSIKRRHASGKKFSIIVASEGAVPSDTDKAITASEKKDAFGNIQLGGIAKFLSEELEQKTGFETRHVVLGHLQRGGSPTSYDRILATRYGVEAVEMVKRSEFGCMVSFSENKIITTKLADVEDGYKLVDMDIYNIAKIFFK